MSMAQESEPIETGVDATTLTPDVQLAQAVADVRRLEEQVRAGFVSSEDDLLRAKSIVACGLVEAEDICRTAASTSELRDRLVALRGPYVQGRARNHARELARLLALLAEGTRPPTTLKELIDLHELVIRDEPVFFARSARTDLRHGYTPFTAALSPDEELPAWLHTVPEERIKTESEALLDFVACANVDIEVRAVVAHHLTVIIHPFFDGNGHTARALAALVLGDSYTTSTKLAFMHTMQMGKYKEALVIVEARKTHADLATIASYKLRQLANAQSSLIFPTLHNVRS